MDICPLYGGSLAWRLLRLDLLLTNLQEVVRVQHRLLLSERGLLRCEVAAGLDGGVQRAFVALHASGCHSPCLT